MILIEKEYIAVIQSDDTSKNPYLMNPFNYINDRLLS